MAASDRPGYYDDLDFNSPMTDETASELVAMLRRLEPLRVVDVGCGWAELLLRLLEACPKATAIGIDHDDVLLSRAARHAADRGVADRVELRPQFDGQLLADADLALCVGSEHVVGSRTDALRMFHEAMPPQSWLLLGTAFWETTPSDALVADFGQLPDLGGLLDAVAAAGWRTGSLLVATDRDWDRFEFGFMADMSDDKVDDYRGAYLARRGVLGFAYLLLQRS